MPQQLSSNTVRQGRSLLELLLNSAFGAPAVVLAAMGI
jgi:hypothetical protein